MIKAPTFYQNILKKQRFFSKAIFHGENLQAKSAITDS